MTYLRAIAPGHIRYNGGIRCDMAVGPCACGARHTESEGIPQADRLSVLYKPEDRRHTPRSEPEAAESQRRNDVVYMPPGIPDVADDATTADAVSRLVRERDEAIELCSTSIALADGHIARARKERDEARAEETKARRLIADNLSFLGQLEERDTIEITVWRFGDAPEHLQQLSTQGGDEEWVVWIPNAWFDRHGGGVPIWIERFANEVEYHDIEGGTVVIGAH